MKLKSIKKYWLLIVIIVLAAALRLFQLGEVPTGPNWDEAALGYNAYSVLTTGKDEYGTQFPLSLRSYNDYKPPLYMYLTIPSVKLFGLSLWSVRLPAVVVGILAVIGTYFMTREILSFSKKYATVRYLPYLAAFLLALSPWHLQFSRMAFEAGIGVGLTIWAATCFFMGLRKQRYLSASAFLFALTLYAYHSYRIFTPLLVLLLGAIFFKTLLKDWKKLIVPIVVGVITLMPLIPVLTDSTTLTRLRGTSALADQTKLLERSVVKLATDRENNDIIGQLFDNRRVVFVQTLVSGYLSHYSLNWLFVTGDNARHHAPGMGLMYVFELPLLLMGIYALAKHGKKAALIVFGWILISPIAASPTTELPHAIRSMVVLPSLQILVAVGIWQGLQIVQIFPKLIARGIVVLFLGAAMMNGLYYLNMYYIHQNHEFSKYWQYGYEQAVDYVKEHYNEYEKIVVSTKLEQPHMFFLFFLKYDPRLYLAQGGTSSGGFSELNHFDKYEFRPIQWDQERLDGKTLYIGSPSEIIAPNVQIIHYLNGEEAIRMTR